MFQIHSTAARGLSRARSSLLTVRNCMSTCTKCPTKGGTGSCNVPPRAKLLDICNVTAERAGPMEVKLIRKFLYQHYWTMEPSSVGLWVPLNGDYVRFMTDKYANSVHRIMALDVDPCTGQRRLVGLAVSSVLCPWQASHLDSWARSQRCPHVRNRLHFMAHCQRHPALFKKYNLDHIFELELLVVARGATHRGVGSFLVRETLRDARELHFPLTMVICTSHYAARIMQRLKLQKEWEMRYYDFQNEMGQRVFNVRHPHRRVEIYTYKLGDSLKI